MEGQKKIKVLKRHYSIKVGDRAPFKVARLYKVADAVRMFLDMGYNVSTETVEHMCEMTPEEITIARAHDADICILADCSVNHSDQSQIGY